MEREYVGEKKSKILFSLCECRGCKSITEKYHSSFHNFLSVKYPHDNLQVVIIYDKLDQMMIYA